MRFATRNSWQELLIKYCAATLLLINASPALRKSGIRLKPLYSISPLKLRGLWKRLQGLRVRFRGMKFSHNGRRSAVSLARKFITLLQYRYKSWSSTVRWLEGKTVQCRILREASAE